MIVAANRDETGRTIESNVQLRFGKPPCAYFVWEDVCGAGFCNPLCRLASFTVVGVSYNQTSCIRRGKLCLNGAQQFDQGVQVQPGRPAYVVSCSHRGVAFVSSAS